MVLRFRYSSTRNTGRRDEPTYRDLMVAADRGGIQRSYLSSEEAFTFVKRLETDNLLVPLIGNFAGPRTIRAVADYLTMHGATVSMFYLSNVEEYLRRDGTWKTFCGNVSTLPVDQATTFIRSVRGDTPNVGFRLTSELGAVVPELSTCGAEQ